MKASSSKSELFRRLPSVDELLRSPALTSMIDREGRTATTDAARSLLERIRAEIAAGRLDDRGLDLALEGMADAVERELRRTLSYSLRRVINATGVVLHTNLGRAPLSEAALEHAKEVSLGYSNLEFEVEAGERGKRDVHVNRLFSRLLNVAEGAEISTVVVNNNAAAVMLALNSLAEGGEVIVSRGELVEIGGAFRIPHLRSKNHANLCEVGTTNRTRLGDYATAINDKTKLLLRVHRSNFRIVGFTEQPSLEELVALGREKGIPVLEDQGSGALVDLANFGVPGEATVEDSLRAGVDVVTYSGDKLLGGPQVGILSGKREQIARVRSNPMFRALRVDKLIYAALEATLLAYVKHDHDAIPALRMMRLSAEEIGRRAEQIVKSLEKTAAKLKAEIIAGESVIGGGAAPGSNLPTRLIALSLENLGANECAARLRQSDPPIIARVEEGRVLLDLRTVFPEQEQAVVSALQNIATA
jgi:L-seryl-tRNA(Ser) seleniumtransferase